MNNHREIIYSRRRNYLEGKELKPQIIDMLADQVELRIKQNTNPQTSKVEFDKLNQSLELIIPIEPNWHEELKTHTPEVIKDQLMKLVNRLYEQREAEFGEA